MKKGFTLIELLAVLAILGVIIMISVPTIGTAIKKSKVGACKQQITQIENAARTYMAKKENAKNLPVVANGTYTVSVATLISSGLLKGNSSGQIVNPLKKQTDSGYIITGNVIITYKGSKYTYKLENSENICK